MSSTLDSKDVYDGDSDDSDDIVINVEVCTLEVMIETQFY